jgi:hypothetical protein
MNPVFLSIVVFALLAPIGGVGAPADYEKDLMLKLVEGRSPGGAVWLGTGKNTFLSFYEEASSEHTRNAAIILPSMGMHADWPELISPMRKLLSENGWSTLSLQLPVLSPGTSISEYGSTFMVANRRIRACIRYLLNKGYDNIIFIGLGFGVTTAVQYLVGSESAVKALVGISMQNHEFLKPKFDLMEKLPHIKQPILDVYAGQDSLDVMKSIHDRRLAGSKKENKLYDQMVINNTQQYFSGRESELVNVIINWLGTRVTEN